MEEKQMMTNEQLEAEINSARRKDKISNLLMSCAGVVLILTFVLKIYPLAILAVVLLLLGASLYSNSRSMTKKLLSDNVISGVLKEMLGDDVEYNPSGRMQPTAMEFPFSYNCSDGSDYIKAVYKGVSVELGDVVLMTETEYEAENGETATQRDIVFRGQWLSWNLGRELTGRVFVSQRPKKDHSKMKSNVTTGNEQFDKRFCVKADHQDEAYYILTPDRMENIISMADKSGGTVYLSFLEAGQMNVAVQTGRDSFEPGKGNVNVEELRRKFLDDLHRYTDILDMLHIEESRNKKEENI